MGLAIALRSFPAAPTFPWGAKGQLPLVFVLPVEGFA